LFVFSQVFTALLFNSQFNNAVTHKKTWTSFSGQTPRSHNFQC